ncbi:MAG: T9SS type A sorting domain-containing protein [Saprospiraceae bacterium]
MKRLIFLPIFLLILVSKGLACDCIYIDNFCEHLTYNNNGQIQSYFSVYHIKITGKQTDGVNVNVIKSYHGSDLTGTNAFVQRGNGANCQIYTDTFSIGEEYIVATTGDSDWWISNCGVSYLKVVNGSVIGQITPNISQVSLADFTSIVECGEMVVTPTNDPFLEGAIQITPTLANDFVEIRSSLSHLGKITLTVFDLSGRLIFVGKHIDFNGQKSLSVDMNSWSNGVYIFKLNTANKAKVVKVVKQRF